MGQSPNIVFGRSYTCSPNSNRGQRSLWRHLTGSPENWCRNWSCMAAHRSPVPYNTWSFVGTGWSNLRRSTATQLQGAWNRSCLANQFEMSSTRLTRPHFIAPLNNFQNHLRWCSRWHCHQSPFAILGRNQSYPRLSSKSLGRCMISSSQIAKMKNLFRTLWLISWSIAAQK